MSTVKLNKMKTQVVVLAYIIETFIVNNCPRQLKYNFIICYALRVKHLYQTAVIFVNLCCHSGSKISNLLPSYIFILYFHGRVYIVLMIKPMLFLNKIKK